MMVSGAVLMDVAETIRKLVVAAGAAGEIAVDIFKE
jgi:hypothetical protein